MQSTKGDSVDKGWDVGAGVGWNLSYPYGRDGAVPATGIRSAVPLGGMGTGNFELRGDGTFRQWCIESQSPGGGWQRRGVLLPVATYVRPA